MGLAPILPGCSVTWAASSCRKPSAGVVAACSEEGGLSRVGPSSPAEPSDECPAKNVSGPDPGRPAHSSAEKCFELSKARALPLSVGLYPAYWNSATKLAETRT